MALGTDHFSAADMSVFTPEIWGTGVNDYFKNALGLATFFTDRSDEVAMGGDVLYTPNITALTVSSKTVGSQVVLSSPTETTATLTIGTHKHVAFIIEDAVKAQVKASYNIQERYAKNAAYEIANDLETALAALFPSLTAAVGTTTVALTEAVCRQAIATLSTAIKGSFRKEDVRFVLAPKTIWQDAMTSDRFVSFDFGQNGSGKEGQRVPYIYGIEVIESTYLTKVNTNADYSGALIHKDAIHFATAALPGASVGADGVPGVRLQSAYVLEYLGDLVVADIKYGVVLNRDAAGVEIISAV